MTHHDWTLLSLAAGTAILISGCGMFLKRLLVSYLRRMSAQTETRVDDIVINALDRVFLLCFVFLGLAAAGEIAGHLLSRFLPVYQRVVTVGFIGTMFWFVAEIIGNAMDAYAEQISHALPAVTIFKNLGKAAVLLVGFLVILQTLGISIAPIITTLGVGGLAVALALKDTLADFFAGLNIIAGHKVRVGDFVRLETGEEGFVVDISWKNTTIRQLSNNLTIIPNSKLAASTVTNYCMPSKDLAVLINLGVSYDSDLEHVERVLLEVAREVMRTVPGGVPDFEPFIRYNTFGDFSIGLTVIMRAREFVDQHLLKHEFIKRAQRRFGPDGIRVPFLIRTVNLAAGTTDRHADENSHARHS